MAPVSQADSHDVVEKQLKDVIQDLYQLMIQVNSYDLAGRPSRDVLENSVKQLDLTLQKIHTTANNPTTQLPSIPPELIQYVDTGRNPDIYTREFVELARRGNQLMRGKLEAFGSFRDVLAEVMVAGLPELKKDIVDVVVKTGGREEVVEKEDQVS
ncbi:Transcription factor subunit Med10 of Mediator complex domain containing protein [Hyaloscypha variabilis]|jgi:mediator of RNA polymerase II transcription subunit 10|uniref:Mediator of RNA polymerase II transcription subunit 10 n=1 Tax=Hyaloscypha variabilis (strain UAMH 11265 / GT02V1 / F) TaxID=1149755 RepID=A0A2J6R678_HYAVF|nr:hypothetical protein L207DRAFT_547380 [Hyaloscypha variabilis F]